ncbi:MAG: TIGR02147 family protein [Pseudobdellovibrionaceae bacterium]
MTFLMKKGPQAYLQHLLREKLEEIKSKNKSYSLRAFAQKLGVSHGVLSEVLRDKRRVSEKMALLLCAKSGCSEDEQKALKNLFSDGEKVTLNAKDFAFVSEWQYFAILALMESDFFPTSFSLEEANRLIRKHLRLTEKKTADSLKRLINMELLSYISDDTYELTPYFNYTTEDLPNKVVTKAHIADLEKVKEVMKRTKALEREISSITFSGDSKQMQEAKNMIRDFRMKLGKKMNGTKKDSVYKLNILLYPLTDTTGNDV